MLVSESARRRIREIPMERLLTETDGPFVSVGDRGAEPTDVLQILGGLADLHDMEIQEMRALVFSNFRAVLERAHNRESASNE